MRPKVLSGFLQFLQANAGTIPRLPTTPSNSSFANNPISKRYTIFNVVIVRDLGNFHLTKTEFGRKRMEGRHETNRMLKKKTLNRILHHIAIGVKLTEHAGHMRQTCDDVK
jgi:hypothetical protein